MSGIIQQNSRPIALITFYNTALRVELPNCIAKNNTHFNPHTCYALKYGASQNAPQFEMQKNTKAEGLEKHGMKTMTNAFVIVKE